MNKELQKKISKIFVLTDLLIQEIDDQTKTPTKESKRILDKSRELQDILIPVLDRFYDNKDIRKTTFFIDLQKKFNYNFDREFKRFKL